MKISTNLKKPARVALKKINIMKNIFWLLVIPLLFLLPSKIQAQGFSELGIINGLNSNTYLYSICSDPSGNIYAAGSFTNDSGNPYVAKWNGTAFIELGGLNAMSNNGVIHGLCSDLSGNIYAGIGHYGNTYVTKYDGTSWAILGGDANSLGNNGISCLCSDPLGNIYAAVDSFDGTNYYNYVCKWNGSSWGPLNGLGANSTILTLCSDASGNIYAAGWFTDSSGNPYVAKYNGTAWSELGSLTPLDAVQNAIHTLYSDALGNIYAGGKFTNASGKRYVAKWNGATWSELGGDDALGANGDIFTIAGDTSGNIYAAGGFVSGAESSDNYYVAKYNGTTWSQLTLCNGGDFDDPIESLCSDPKGNIYAGGDFGVAEYSATACVTGINAIKFANSIVVSPNPTNNVFTISLGNTVSNATIKLINLAGQTIFEKPNQSGGKFIFDISSQPQGIYFVEVQQQENFWAGKVVKAN